MTGMAIEDRQHRGRALLDHLKADVGIEQITEPGRASNASRSDCSWESRSTRTSLTVGPARKKLSQLRLTCWGCSPDCRVTTRLYTHSGIRVVDVLPSRVFMNGNSQAVRIPAEFRLNTDRVQISRSADGDLIIHPCPAQRGDALLEILAGFDPTFVDALEQRQRLPIQERDRL